MKTKVAAIGDKDVVMMMKSIGLETFYVNDADGVRETILRLEQDDYKIIFITQTQAAMVEDFLRTYETKPYPIILPIPDSNGNGFGVEKLIKNMERTIGSASSLK